MTLLSAASIAVAISKLRWLLVLTVIFPLSGYAQSLQVIGGNSLAKDCYEVSSLASLNGSASRVDLDVCTRAITDGGLKKKDLVATYVNRGIIYVAMQDFPSAARDYERAIGLSSNVAESYVNRGNLWFLAKRFDEAIQDYERALQLDFSKTHIALLNRGMAKESLGELKEAQQDYLAALNLVEGWPTALAKLERVNRKLKM